MTREVELSEQRLLELQTQFRQSTDADERNRIQAVLMANDGVPRQEIARHLCCTPRTIQRYIGDFLDHGKLKRTFAKGPSRTIPDDLAPIIAEWIKNGPQACGLSRANWTYQELADYLFSKTGIRVQRSAMQDFCKTKLDVRLYRPTYRFLRGDPEKQQHAREELAELKEKADAKELILLSQDEMRIPMVPTLVRTLAIKGHRPVVGTRDCKDLLYLFGAVDVVSGKLLTRTLKSPKDAKKRTGKSKNRRLQEAFCKQLDDIARAYPKAQNPRVVLIIDNAPWHGGPAVREKLAEHEHIEFYRLPSYSPQLNVIERFWKVFRRRTTHNRLFESLAQLHAAVRASISYYQTVKAPIQRLIKNAYPAPPDPARPTPDPPIFNQIVSAGMNKCILSAPL